MLVLSAARISGSLQKYVQGGEIKAGAALLMPAMPPAATPGQPQAPPVTTGAAIVLTLENPNQARPPAGARLPSPSARLVGVESPAGRAADHDCADQGRLRCGIGACRRHDGHCRGRSQGRTEDADMERGRAADRQRSGVGDGSHSSLSAPRSPWSKTDAECGFRWRHDLQRRRR